jgi:hypothetical protein
MPGQFFVVHRDNRDHFPRKLRDITSGLAGDWSLPVTILIHPSSPTANHTITEQHPLSICIITATLSRKPLECTTNDRSTFPLLVTSLPRKHVLGLFVVEMLYRHESSLSLTLRNRLQRSSNALHRVPPQQPRNQCKESTNFSQNEKTCWNSTTSAR